MNDLDDIAWFSENLNRIIIETSSDGRSEGMNFTTEEIEELIEHLRNLVYKAKLHRSEVAFQKSKGKPMM